VVPAIARADGPVAPVATSYLARLRDVPAGLHAIVVDGYLRLWLEVPPRIRLVVLDYRRIPYLRFDRAGVQVNENSTMYYLNQVPVAETPPADLRPGTPPNWQPASGGHSYEWHDGRIQDLSSEALAPGQSYVGAWRIPIVLDGRPTSITGGLDHVDRPSIVWFWPILVLIACVLAGWRVRSDALDLLVGRSLTMIALAAIALASIGLRLHGRPNVTPTQLVEFGLTLAFAVWGAGEVLVRRGRLNYFAYFLIAFVALWEGLDLVPVLLNGHVLIALPAFLARTATVLCLGSGIGILVLAFRLAAMRQRATGVRSSVGQGAQ
jgi:hypothetical protein